MDGNGYAATYDNATTGAGAQSTQLKTIVKVSGSVYTIANTYVSGTGTAGADNTAQTVKTIVLPANTLSQLGDRTRIRVYWFGDTGSPITGTTKLNGVTIGHTTDLGATSPQVIESWLHYIDNTHANIIENESGEIGAASAVNVSGFDFDSDQNIDVTQDQIANNHITVYFIAADIFPKGVA